jgi:hypothetical protein
VRRGARSKGQGPLAISDEEKRKAYEEAKAKLEDTIAFATPVDERSIYLGFAAVKGNGADSSGAADIVVNQEFQSRGLKTGTLFDAAKMTLLVKKNTSKRRSKSYPHRHRDAQSPELGSRAEAADRRKVETKEIEDLQHRNGLFRGLVIQQVFRMEGDASDFKTVDFVSDSQFTLPSVAKRLGSLGYYNFRLVAGPEFGKNMAKPEMAAGSAANAVNYIRRTKTGSDFTLRWGQSEIDPGKFAVELDVAYVNRWIHSPEPVLQDVVKDGKKVQQQVTIGKSTRPWRQADLKVFLFGNDKIRYGLKVSYANGSLIPVKESHPTEDTHHAAHVCYASRLADAIRCF